nr:thioredoxin domain-containing protein [Gemmatimonadota bacterium]
ELDQKKSNRPKKRRNPRVSNPVWKSGKLWVAGGIVAISLLLFFNSRGQHADDLDPASTSRGIPVPLAEAQLDEAAPRRTSVPDSRLIDVADDPKRGRPDAAVRIVEFADFECPSCGQFYEQTEKALRELYGDRIEWVFLDFPLAQHARAMPAAIAGACAHRQGRFWDYHDALFENQRSMGDGDLRDRAKQVGLDVQAWEKCFTNRETEAEVRQDMKLADDLGVDATPTFYVAGETLKGSMPVTSFMEVIDPILAQAGASTPNPAPPGEGPATPPR